jgi:hypothetical protein
VTFPSYEPSPEWLARAAFDLRMMPIAKALCAADTTYDWQVDPVRSVNKKLDELWKAVRATETEAMELVYERWIRNVREGKPR